MSLLDEWNSEISIEQLRQSSTAQTSGAPPDAIFGLEQRAEFLCRGRGIAVAFAAANDTLFVATSRGFLLRHDVSGMTNAVTELEVAKSADARVRRLFVDPLGLHHLLLIQSGNSTEVHHVDSAFKKAKALGKLRGVAVCSVAWGTRVQTGSLSNVLLGSETGVLYELSIDENRKERVKQLFTLKDDHPAITGLLQASLGHEKRLVLALCGTRLHAFVGGPTLEQLFARYADGSAPLKFIELPLDDPASQLHSLSAPSAPDPAVAEGAGSFEVPPPQVFAVLSPSGIYYGQLDLDPGLPDETDHLVKHHLLPAAVTQQQQPQQAQQVAPAAMEAPLSLALTQYHFVLLYGSKLQYVNRVSKQVVQEVPLDRFAAPLRGATTMPLGLCRDHVAGRVAVMAGDDAFEVDAADEDRDMWRVFLEKGEFRAALLHCRTPRQRNAVYLAQGESLFEEGDYVGAAALFGKLTSTVPSFEELALRLMEAGDGEAVLAFLTTRLDTLGREDRAQATMVATWLTELLLDQVNRALLDQRDPEGEARYGQLVEQLRSFLQRHVDVLDPGTTVGLLSGYGRVDELMHYASCRGDNESLLEYLLQHGEAQKALEVLRKPSVSPELFYKFASGLVALAPTPTVQAWIDAQPPLDPRRLLPALLQFGEGAGPGYREALKYVRFCLHRLGSTDAAIHNLAVALLSLEPDSEDALLEYLRTARDPLGQPLYDAVHALRLVRERGRLRASVQLFCEVGMYEDAVALALTFNRQLATAIARRGEGSEGLSRKLWLAIARHIIEQGPKPGAEGQGGGDERIAEVGALLEEAAGTVRIEDILPLFPDFVEIGAFKDAICSSLEKYNQEIEDLRHEMQAASATAHAIREELARLDHRSAALDLSEPCARCGRPLFQPPPMSAGPSGGSVPRLYLFPTGNAFHGSCLCGEVCTLAPPQQKARIQRLVERLAKVSEAADAAVADADGSGPASVQQLRQQLEAEVATEDPYNGEIVARNINKPFVLPSEMALAESWAV